MGQSFQPHIQQLLQAGIATHFVQNDTAVDPVFAVSKTQDFPEVTFAAAFEDGTVVLGCKGALPKPLIGLAQPIVPVDTQTVDQTDAKLDAILARLEQVDAADARQPTPRDDEKLLAVLDAQMTLGKTLQDQLTSVATAVGNLPQDSNNAATDSALNALHTQLETLTETMQSPPHADRISQDLAQLRGDIAQLLPLIAAQQALPTADAIETLIADLETRLTAQTAATPAPDLTPQTEAINAMEQALTQGLSTVSNDVKTLITMHDTTEDSSTTEAQLSELKTALENLPGLAAIGDKLATISEQLGGLTDKKSHDPAQDQLSAQINTLVTDVAAMSQRPDPTLDLTEQRQGLARFQTAMNTVLGRLEQAIADLADVGQTNQKPETQDLHNKLDTLADTLSPVESLPAQFADLTEQRQGLLQSQTAMATILRRVELAITNLSKVEDTNKKPETQHLHDKLDTLADTLAPVESLPAQLADLTEQQQGLLQFQTAIAPVLERMELAMANLSEVHETSQKTDTQDLHAKLDMLSDTFASVSGLPAQFADLTASLAPLPQQSDTILGQLSELSLRADPATYETAQRRSMAYFANAISSIIARIETTADAMGNDNAQPDLTPLLTRIEASLSAVAAQPQADVGEILQAQRDDLNVLRADIATLCERPLPTIDLTAQRASFAQFATALRSILERFEGIAAQIEAPQEVQLPPNPAEPHQDETAPSFSDNRISLDALRLDFAELIAKQIMDHTHQSPPLVDHNPG
ncbi:hypothetical protein BC777_0254 [Yoonia maricola]|uniref:Uncharacterized protein n=2 Tax=Yoonia maricola TaxID=420999 RepID=A0A2M8WKL0_9RHOB|nr:hypothetical protein BC777_0254 [Yoonia maricola]